MLATIAAVWREGLRDDLAGFNGYIQDKVEGMAIFDDGTTWISTDNDGVDDSSGGAVCARKNVTRQGGLTLPFFAEIMTRI